MDNTEKQSRIKALALKFLQSTNADELQNIRIDILKEVASGGNLPQTSPSRAKALEAFGDDLKDYIVAVKNNLVTPAKRQFVELSLVGLSNL